MAELKMDPVTLAVFGGRLAQIADEDDRPPKSPHDLLC